MQLAELIGSGRISALHRAMDRAFGHQPPQPRPETDLRACVNELIHAARVASPEKLARLQVWLSE
jgi:hypothetical protein